MWNIELMEHPIIGGRCDRVSYYHVELATHEVLFAKELPAETYPDTGNRAAFVIGCRFVAA